MIDVQAMPHLADIPRVQAGIRPDAEAFWFEGETTSFGELETRSTQVANGLIALGVQPDDRVGYLAKNMPSITKCCSAQPRRAPR
jgi:long-chain acyl-CoA synthetase